MLAQGLQQLVLRRCHPKPLQTRQAGQAFLMKTYQSFRGHLPIKALGEQHASVQFDVAVTA